MMKKDVIRHLLRYSAITGTVYTVNDLARDVGCSVWYARKVAFDLLNEGEVTYKIQRFTNSNGFKRLWYSAHRSDW